MCVCSTFSRFLLFFLFGAKFPITWTISPHITPYIYIRTLCTYKTLSHVLLLTCNLHRIQSISLSISISRIKFGLNLARSKMQVALNSILPLHFLISNFRIFWGQTCIWNCAQNRSILFWFDEFICLLWLCIQTHKHKSNSNFFQINKQINPFNAFKPHNVGRKLCYMKI